MQSLQVPETVGRAEGALWLGQAAVKIAHSSGLIWSLWLVVMKPSGTFCRGTLTYTHPALLPF